MSSQNYTNMFFLRACITVHKFDIICLPGTYLNSSTWPDDGNLEIV